MPDRTTDIECADGGTLRELARGPWGQLTMRTVPPGKSAGGRRHPNTNEVWWIVAGSAELEVNGCVFVPRLFDAVYVVAGTRHLVRNVGESDVVLVWWSDRMYEEQEKVD